MAISIKFRNEDPDKIAELLDANGNVLASEGPGDGETDWIIIASGDLISIRERSPDSPQTPN